MGHWRIAARRRTCFSHREFAVPEFLQPGSCNIELVFDVPDTVDTTVLPSEPDAVDRAAQPVVKPRHRVRVPNGAVEDYTSDRGGRLAGAEAE